MTKPYQTSGDYVIPVFLAVICAVAAFAFVATHIDVFWPSLPW